MPPTGDINFSSNIIISIALQKLIVLHYSMMNGIALHNIIDCSTWYAHQCMMMTHVHYVYTWQKLIIVASLSARVDHVCLAHETLLDRCHFGWLGVSSVTVKG